MMCILGKWVHLNAKTSCDRMVPHSMPSSVAMDSSDLFSSIQFHLTSQARVLLECHWSAYYKDKVSITNGYIICILAICARVYRVQPVQHSYMELFGARHKKKD